MKTNLTLAKEKGLIHPSKDSVLETQISSYLVTNKFDFSNHIMGRIIDQYHRISCLSKRNVEVTEVNLSGRSMISIVYEGIIPVVVNRDVFMNYSTMDLVFECYCDVIDQAGILAFSIGNIIVCKPVNIEVLENSLDTIEFYKKWVLSGDLGYLYNVYEYEALSYFSVDCIGAKDVSFENIINKAGYMKVTLNQSNCDIILVHGLNWSILRSCDIFMFGIVILGELVIYDVYTMKIVYCNLAVDLLNQLLVDQDLDLSLGERVRCMAQYSSLSKGMVGSLNVLDKGSHKQENGVSFCDHIEAVMKVGVPIDLKSLCDVYDGVEEEDLYDLMQCAVQHKTSISHVEYKSTDYWIKDIGQYEISVKDSLSRIMDKCEPYSIRQLTSDLCCDGLKVSEPLVAAVMELLHKKYKIFYREEACDFVLWYLN